MTVNATLKFWLNVRADSHRETLRGMKGCMRSSPLLISSRLDEIHREAWKKQPRNKVSMKAGSGTEVAQTSSLALYTLCVCVCELCFYSLCKCVLYRSLSLCMYVILLSLRVSTRAPLSFCHKSLICSRRIGFDSSLLYWWEPSPHTPKFIPFHYIPPQLFFQ